MPTLLRFLARRLAAIPITLVIVTMAIYAVAMLMPPEIRARLYWPPGTDEELMSASQVQRLNAQIIRDYGLNDPFLIQYLRWGSKLVRGEWGYSSALNMDVLAALIRRSPATAELTLYSILLLIPLGLIGGVTAGRHRRRLPDHGFRITAFVATSIPAFILALVLITIFYAGLNWFPPGRLDRVTTDFVTTPQFSTITGLLVVDGLLNGRPDISLEALRHLVLPVITLSLAHWATLGRVTRTAMIEELSQPYVTAALGRGLSRRTAIWRHALRNAILPALNSGAVSAASLITGVFVVEVIFVFPGVSEMVVVSAHALDIPLVMGVTLYSIMIVLPLMIILDVLQAVVDPRIREGMS